MIRARGLLRRFGDFVAVNEVDLSVAPGEVFGLLGANGAGKTTTIRMLCGLLPPSAGDIEVAGIDMVRRARRARGRIGYVSQRFALYGDLSVRENLELQAGLFGLAGRRRRERIRWALRHMELEERAGAPAGDIPLGYQRRLSLAAALLHEPDVLFLDEPTSGVDPAARQHFWGLIYDLAESGIGILVTTHYMDEAEFCDRLAMMHAGRVVLEGAPAELVRSATRERMLSLRAPATGELARALAGLPGVIEIIPHSGRLRLRLRAAADAAELRARIEGQARRLGMPAPDVDEVEPDLEDVFVALLETEDEDAAA